MADFWTCVFCHRNFPHEKESADDSSKNHYCVDCAERLEATL